MRVLIAGCGYVGTQLGLELAGAGMHVTGIRRHPHSLPPELHPIAGDLLDPTLAGKLPEVDAVVYLAAADDSTPEGYRRTYVEGPRNLLRALTAQNSRIRRILFVSSTAVYGSSDGGWVDEDTPPAPESFRGERMLEGEAVAASAPYTVILVRFGGIYGPGRSRLLRLVRAGDARCPQPGPVWSNRIHRDDAAGVLRHLLNLPDPEPCYLAVDDEPSSICEVYRHLAKRLGAPTPIATPVETRSRSNKRCSNRRLRESGYVFRFPSFREGYAAMIEAGE